MARVLVPEQVKIARLLNTRALLKRVDVDSLLDTIDALQAVVTAAEELLATHCTFYASNLTQPMARLSNALADLKRKQGESVKPDGGGE